MAKCGKNPVAKMKHRLTLQTSSQVSDGQGGYTENWSNTANLWASLEPTKGYERMQAMHLETPVTHKILTRYRSGVTTAQRFQYGTRVFHIKEVLNVDEENAFLKILAQEVL